MISITRLTVVLVGVASAAQAMTLQEAMVQALEFNPTIAAARASLGEVQEDKRQAFASFLPTLAVTGTYDIQRRSTLTDVANTTHPRQVGVTLSQPLFNGGGNLAAYKSARQSALQEENALATQIQTTLLATVEGYMDFLTGQDVLTQRQNLVGVLEKQLLAAQVRFEQGDVTRTDVEQARARLASARADVMQADADLTSAEERLRVLLGELPTAPLIWPAFLPEGLPLDIDEVKDDVLENHPKLLASLHALSAKRYDVKVARAGHLPDVNAHASYSYSENGIGTIDNVQKVGVDVSIPLYSGGAVASSVRGATYAEEAALEAYELSRREVLAELRNAWRTYLTNRRTSEAFELAKKAAKLATNGVNREVELGERSILDALDAEQEFLDAQVSHTQAKANVVVSSYRLLAAMGELVHVPQMGRMEDVNIKEVAPPAAEAEVQE